MADRSRRQGILINGDIMTFEQLHQIIIDSISWTSETELYDLVPATAWPRIKRIAIMDLRDIGLPIMDVMVVNGGEYRSSRIQVQDFVEGGNHGRWPDCGKTELWIDDDTASDEVLDVMVHEASESFAIRRLGLEYEDAHSNWANPTERIQREKELNDRSTEGQRA